MSAVLYHYDQNGRRIAESTESGLMLKEYVVALGRTIAEIDRRPLRVEPSNLDFGNIERAVENVRSVRLVNRGDTSIQVARPPSWPVEVSTGTAFPVTLEPGEALTIPIALRAQSLGPLATRASFCANGREYRVDVRATAEPGLRNSNRVAPTAAVTHSFPADVDASTVGPASFVVHGMETGRLDGIYTVEGREVRFQPNHAMKAGERVYVTVTRGWVDRNSKHHVRSSLCRP